MPALGTKELRFGALIWGHGGGIPGALGLAASAIVTGQAEVVAVYRSLAEHSGARLRVAVAQDDTAAQYLVNGMDGPVQICALRSQRMLEADGVPASTMFAMARAAYHHASNNPDAAAYGKRFDETVYAASRFVSEPYRLFDCSRENDGGVAVILTSAERAADLVERPAYLLSAPTGAGPGGGRWKRTTGPIRRAGSRRWPGDSGAHPATDRAMSTWPRSTRTPRAWEWGPSWTTGSARWRRPESSSPSRTSNEDAPWA